MSWPEMERKSSLALTCRGGGESESGPSVIHLQSAPVAMFPIVESCFGVGGQAWLRRK